MLRTFSISSAIRVLRLVLSLATASLLGHYLGREGFGHLSVAMATVGVLLCIGELGLARYTVRELMLGTSSEADTLGTTIGMRLRVASLLFLGLALYVYLCRPSGSVLLMLYGMQLLSNPCTELFAWCESKQLIERLSWLQFIGFVLSAVAIMLGVWLHWPLWYFAITYAIEGWSIFALTVWLFRRNGGRVNWRSFEFSKARTLFSRSWFELASQLSLFLLFRLDAVMIKALRGVGEAGLYSASVRISEVMYFIPGILSVLCLPRLIELRKTDATAYEQRVVDYFSLSLVVALAAATALAFGAPVVQLIFGADFHGSSDILVVHAWAFIPFALGIARTQYLTVEDKLWVNLPSVIAALIINVTLNYLWIPQHGGVGAAWATLVAYAVAWLGSSFVMPSAASELRSLMLRAIAQAPAFSLRSLQRLRQAA